jgi:hypothetical protein
MTTGNTGNRARKPIAVGIAAVIALSGAFALGTTAPVNAAPLSISQTAVKEAAPDNVIDVRRRRYRSGHAIAGLALGIIGTALAYKYHRDYHRHHYHRHYYHGGYYPHYGYRYGRGCDRVHNHRNSVVSWRCR